MAKGKNKGGKMRNTGDLPSKDCATCGLPFSWRKKWEKDWDEVKFCSDRCRRNKSFEKNFDNPANSGMR